MDRFDDIWKNRFNDGSAPIEDWNSPDDKLVWEGISQQIPTKSKKRKLFWWWWVIAAIITLGLLFSFISTDENQVEQQSTEQLDVPSSQLNSSTTEKNKTQSINTEKDISKSSTTTSSNQKKFLRSLNTVTKDEKSGFDLSATHSANSTSSAVRLLETEEIMPQESSEIALGNSEVEKIQELNISALEIEENVDLEIPELNFNNSSKKFLISFNAGIVYWQHQISEQYTTDLSPFEFNYTDNFGWQSNLGITYQINKKIAFFSGLQYEQIEGYSGHNSELTYDIHTEQNHSNDYTQALATPYGLAEASFRFNRIEDIGDDEVELLVDFKSRHLIQNWSLPFGVTYSLLSDRKRLQPSISVGFGVNYLHNISNTIHQIDTHHDAIQYKSDGVNSFSRPDLNRWHYDIRMGLGLNYQLIPDLGIQFQYNWTKGLTPVFQQENYETKIDRHHWSLGIQKTFGNF